MDWLTFIVEMTKALGSFAWPVATVVTIILLRQPIGKLILNITKVKYGDQFEIAFDRELREVEKQAETTLPEPREVTKIVTGHIEAVGRAEGKAELTGAAEVIDTNERARRMAEHSPAAAIVDAWLELEGVLRSVASASGIEVTDRSNPPRLMKALLSMEKVDRQTYEIFGKLRDLRNRAVHERQADLSVNQALEYAGITRRLAAKLLLLHKQ